MEIEPEADHKSKKSRRQVALYGFGVGAGVSSTLLLGFALWLWYESRPARWSTQTLTASDATVGLANDILDRIGSGGSTNSGPPSTLPPDFEMEKQHKRGGGKPPDPWEKYELKAPPQTLTPEQEETLKKLKNLLDSLSPQQRAAYEELSRRVSLPPEYKLARETRLQLTFNLQNNTNRDLAIPKGVTIMKRDAQTNALEATPELTWDGEPFIPAKQKVQILMSLVLYCTGSADSCLAEKYKRGERFVIFDHANRLQIEVPIPIHSK
jgi:hypothetical protein